MSRRDQRVSVELNARGIRNLRKEEIQSILRGADELIATGGRTLLAKILKGSRDQKILELGLEKCPVYGYYQQLTLEDITARIDWTILHDYLSIEYDGRLPMLVYTHKGWEIEKETFANELVQEFDEKLRLGEPSPDMTYLKDRNRGLILLFLDKIEASEKKEYIPLLEAWEKIDYKKVRQRIREVIQRLGGEG